jgi:hypothetical protein
MMKHTRLMLIAAALLVLAQIVAVAPAAAQDDPPDRGFEVPPIEPAAEWTVNGEVVQIAAMPNGDVLVLTDDGQLTRFDPHGVPQALLQTMSNVQIMWWLTNEVYWLDRDGGFHHLGADGAVAESWDTSAFWESLPADLGGVIARIGPMGGLHVVMSGGSTMLHLLPGRAEPVVTALPDESRTITDLEVAPDGAVFIVLDGQDVFYQEPGADRFAPLKPAEFITHDPEFEDWAHIIGFDRPGNPVILWVPVSGYTEVEWTYLHLQRGSGAVLDSGSFTIADMFGDALTPEELDSVRLGGQEHFIVAGFNGQDTFTYTLLSRPGLTPLPILGLTAQIDGVVVVGTMPLGIYDASSPYLALRGGPGGLQIWGDPHVETHGWSWGETNDSIFQALPGGRVQRYDLP